MKRLAFWVAVLLPVIFVASVLGASEGSVESQTLAQVGDDPSELVNVAPEGAASQSTTRYRGVASRAIDGNTSGVWRQRSVTHTNPTDSLPWWGLELAESTSIDNIVLWNRTNCCSDRLADFSVFLSDAPFDSEATIAELLADPAVWSFSFDGAAGETVDIPVGATGQYLRIQKPAGTALSLAEVQVFEAPTTGTATEALVLLGDASDTGEGRSTSDLSGNTILTVASGDTHTNGDLVVQNPSQLISEQAVTASGELLCTNPNDPNCLPDQAAEGEPVLDDPLASLPGAPYQETSQQWPNCNSTCSVEPGRYRGPFNINSNNEILLSPGYYSFESQVLNLNGTLRLDPDAEPHPETGLGVMLFFETGSYLEIGSEGSLQFDPPEAGPYEDVAIYYERGNTATLGWRASNNDMPGWVYGADAHLRLNNDNSGWIVNNRFVFETMNSQGGNYTIDPDGWDGWSGGDVEPPFEPEAEVVPIFECYVEQADGTYTAFFGYENSTVGEDGELVEITVPFGADNALSPVALDGVQPTSFGFPDVVDGRPGRTAFEDVEPNAFIVEGWDGSDIVWTLLGETATASLATNCASQPPLGPECLGQDATIIGTDGDDVLVGTEGDDVIFAGTGNDVVDGLGGNDTICGEEGEDVLNGNAGADLIDGGEGNDVVDGGPDNDQLFGQAGDDALLGGGGDDSIDGGAGNDAIRAGDGDDVVTDEDPSFVDRDSIDGGLGVDVCDGDLDDEEVAC